MPSSACDSTAAIYTRSLHDALPICEIDLRRALIAAHDLEFVSEDGIEQEREVGHRCTRHGGANDDLMGREFADSFDRRGVPHKRNVDRKSTRLNSSHRCISYAVFCL